MNLPKKESTQTCFFFFFSLFLFSSTVKTNKQASKKTMLQDRVTFREVCGLFERVKARSRNKAAVLAAFVSDWRQSGCGDPKVVVVLLQCFSQQQQQQQEKKQWQTLNCVPALDVFQSRWILSTLSCALCSQPLTLQEQHTT